jgi:hypothetical protein
LVILTRQSVYLDIDILFYLNNLSADVSSLRITKCRWVTLNPNFSFESRFQNEAAGAVFTELANFFVFQNSKCFAGEVWPVNVVRIKNRTEFNTSKITNTYFFKPAPPPLLDLVSWD